MLVSLKELLTLQGLHIFHELQQCGLNQFTVKSPVLVQLQITLTWSSHVSQKKVLSPTIWHFAFGAHYAILVFILWMWNNHMQLPIQSLLLVR